MEFVIGSKNPAKVKAVKAIISEHFPSSNFVTADVSSEVSNQPIGDEETRRGAVNRAKNAAATKQGAIGIGLEGGVRTLEDELYLCNWGALVLPTGQTFTAGGAQILLPREIASEILAGKELGEVVDVYFHAKGISHSEGAVGMFTANVVTRDTMFEHVMRLIIGQYKYGRASH